VELSRSRHRDCPAASMTRTVTGILDLAAP
jgi:hypothetical protein